MPSLADIEQIEGLMTGRMGSVGRLKLGQSCQYGGALPVVTEFVIGSNDGFFTQNEAPAPPSPPPLAPASSVCAGGTTIPLSITGFDASSAPGALRSGTPASHAAGSSCDAEQLTGLTAAAPSADAMGGVAEDVPVDPPVSTFRPRSMSSLDKQLTAPAIAARGPTAVRIHHTRRAMCIARSERSLQPCLGRVEITTP